MLCGALGVSLPCSRSSFRSSPTRVPRARPHPYRPSFAYHRRVCRIPPFVSSPHCAFHCHRPDHYSAFQLALPHRGTIGRVMT